MNENIQSETNTVMSPTSGRTARTNNNATNLAKIKLKWDSLSEMERSEFIQRVEAEKSIKEFLRTGSQNEYIPVNSYAQFLKEQITKDS